MYQQKWRRWIADQGGQFDFLKPEIEILASFEHLWLFLEIKMPDKIRLFSGFFQSKSLALAKHFLNCIFITNLFWRESMTMQGTKNIAKILLLP